MYILTLGNNGFRLSTTLRLSEDWKELERGAPKLPDNTILNHKCFWDADSSWTLKALTSVPHYTFLVSKVWFKILKWWPHCQYIGIKVCQNYFHSSSSCCLHFKIVSAKVLFWDKQGEVHLSFINIHSYSIAWITLWFLAAAPQLLCLWQMVFLDFSVWPEMTIKVT